jgi:Protein of unknown function (DUF3631)
VIDESAARRVLAAYLTRVETFTRRFVVLTDEQTCAIALWVAHTHVFEAALCTPYLAISSAEKESGKTRLLEVLELLVAKPWFTGRTSTAALTRKIDRDAPTLLLDESDPAFKGDRDYAEALRGVLNTGFRRGGSTSLCVPEGKDGFKIADLSTFSPKAIAGIGRLPDTVASRSIPIRLKMRKRSEPIQRFRARNVRDDAAELADTLANELQRIAPELAGAEPSLPDELSDRQQDVWEPLVAIGDAARGKWPVRVRHAAVVLAGSRRSDSESLRVRLLADIWRVFEGDDVDRIKSRELAQRLNSMDDAPWADWARGKGLTPNKLGSMLGEFDIHPRSIRYEGESSTAKGYLRAMFEDAWERHVPQEGGPETAHRHNGLPEPKTPLLETARDPACAGSENGHKGLEQANVPPVPFQAGGSGRSRLAELGVPAYDDEEAA